MRVDEGEIGMRRYGGLHTHTHIHTHAEYVGMGRRYFGQGEDLKHYLDASEHRIVIFLYYDSLYFQRVHKHLQGRGEKALDK